MDVLLDRHAHHSSTRMLASTAPPRSASERHYRDHGHRLQHGCCRPTH